MKSAVFQLNKPDGWAQLIVVRVGSLHDALELERALCKQYGGGMHVSFLGRFDRIDMASNLSELLDIVVGASGRAPRRLEKFNAIHETMDNPDLTANCRSYLDRNSGRL